MMIARVQTIQPAPGGLARAIEILRDAELPVYRQAAGFVGLIVLASLTDSINGERVEAISLWDDQEALAAFTATAGQREGATPMMPILLSATEEHIYEVAQAAGMVGGTVTRFIPARIQPDHIETVVTIFENVVMHAATEQLGFRRGILLVNRTSGRVISIGFWQSEADLQASERVGYLGQQIGNFTHIVTSRIVPETLSVAVEV
jgi:heme-degrading monooxygenase HmoA